MLSQIIELWGLNTQTDVQAKKLRPTDRKTAKTSGIRRGGESICRSQYTGGMKQMHHIKPLIGDGDHKDSYLAMFKGKRIDKYRKTRYYKTIRHTQGKKHNEH